MKEFFKIILFTILSFITLVIFFEIVGLLVNILSKLPVMVGVSLFIIEIIFILKKVR